MTIVKLIKAVAVVTVLCVATIAALGFYKFNILADDIFIEGRSVVEAEITGTWIERGHDGRTSRLVLKPEGMAQLNSADRTATYGWCLEDGELVLTSVMTDLQAVTKPVEVFKVGIVGKYKMEVTDASGRLRTFNRASPPNPSRESGFRSVCRADITDESNLTIGEWKVAPSDILRVLWLHGKKQQSGVFVAFTSRAETSVRSEVNRHQEKTLSLSVKGRVISNPVV